MNDASDGLHKLSVLLHISADTLKEMTKVEGIDGKIYDVFELSFELRSLADRVEAVADALENQSTSDAHP